MVVACLFPIFVARPSSSTFGPRGVAPVVLRCPPWRGSIRDFSDEASRSSVSISRDRDETFWATSTMAAIVFYSCSTREISARTLSKAMVYEPFPEAS